MRKRLVAGRRARRHAAKASQSNGTTGKTSSAEARASRVEAPPLALPDVVIPPPVDAPVEDVIDDVADVTDVTDALADAGDATTDATDADDVVTLAGDAGFAGDGGAVEELPPGCQCRAGDSSKPLGRKGLWLLTALLPLLRRRRRMS